MKTMFLMQPFLLGLFAVTVARAMPVAPLKAPSLVGDAHFFENSVRSDVLPAEAPFLVEIHVSPRQIAKSQGKSDDQSIAWIAGYIGAKPTCSGFFVRNTLNKIYVGSSRHCFFFKAQELLEDPEVTIKDFATGHIGRGVRIVAEDVSSDFFLFEASFGENDGAVRAAMTTLKLADLTQPAGEALAAFGFPADAERLGKPTKSAKCATFANDYDTEKQKVYLKGYYAYLALTQKYWALSGPKSPEADELQAIPYKAAQAYVLGNATMIKHNCSIYGGNSGGPMILADLPELVIGLPESYDPSAQILGQDRYGFMETPRRLFEMQGETMRAAGVDYVVLSRADFLKEIAVRNGGDKASKPSKAKPSKAKSSKSKSVKKKKRPKTKRARSESPS